MGNRIKRLLGRIAGYLTPRVNANVLYYTSRMLRLKSEANIVDIEDIKKSRHKDTIFIMGSGYSINDITKEEWQHFVDVGDIFAFNEFYKGKFVPINYYICGEISPSTPSYGSVLMNSKYRKEIKSYYDKIFSNPCYKDTTYFLRYKIEPIKAPTTVALWALFFLKAFKNKQVCSYRIVIQKGGILEPSEDIYAISHLNMTLSDVVNISYILSYKKIVLVGVDLYDRRYFWLERNETRDSLLKRGITYSNIFDPTGNIIKNMDIWNKYLTKKGVRLYIYNPRSLLNTVLPVYRNVNSEKGEFKK